MARIVIIIDGGLIQDVVATDQVEVALVDYDTQGIDEDNENLMKIDGDEAYMVEIMPSVGGLENDAFLDQVFSMVR